MARPAIALLEGETADRPEIFRAAVRNHFENSSPFAEAIDAIERRTTSPRGWIVGQRWRCTPWPTRVFDVTTFGTTHTRVEVDSTGVVVSEPSRGESRLESELDIPFSGYHMLFSQPVSSQLGGIRPQLVEVLGRPANRYEIEGPRSQWWPRAWDFSGWSVTVDAETGIGLEARAFISGVECIVDRVVRLELTDEEVD
jgi:hypothetical protein